MDVVCAIKSSQLSRLKSPNRLCPLNRSTLSYARTEPPSLSAQLSAEMERHLLPPRCSTPPPRRGGGGSEIDPAAKSTAKTDGTT